MAFEALSEKFSKILKKLKGQSKLTESNISDILKEIKFALLPDVSIGTWDDFKSKFGY